MNYPIPLPDAWLTLSLTPSAEFSSLLLSPPGQHALSETWSLMPAGTTGMLPQSASFAVISLHGICSILTWCLACLRPNCAADAAAVTNECELGCC